MVLLIHIIIVHHKNSQTIGYKTYLFAEIMDSKPHTFNFNTRATFLIQKNALKFSWKLLHNYKFNSSYVKKQNIFIQSLPDCINSSWFQFEKFCCASQTHSWISVEIVYINIWTTMCYIWEYKGLEPVSWMRTAIGYQLVQYSSHTMLKQAKIS